LLTEGAGVVRRLFGGICAASVFCAAAVVSLRADDSADRAEFARLDRNEDEVLSGNELKAVPGYDANSDGEVTLAEFLAGRKRDRDKKSKPANPRTHFAEKDLNEDGVLSGKEAKGFERYDTNRDGDITLKEFLDGSARDDAGPPKPPADPVKPESDKPEPQHVPVDPAIKAWNEQLNQQWDQGTRWAVIVGVNKYEKSPLRFCVPDAMLLADALVKHCGYPREQVLLMTDEVDDPRLRPTKIHLQEYIPAILRKAKPQDTVLVYLSGHGLQTEGQSFYCPIDFDGEQTKLTGWRIDELRSILLDCKAVRKLLVLDCCHSGGGVTTSGFGSTPQELGRAFESAQGLITFASCRTNQTSLESAKRGHGIFTDAFVAGLAGQADFDHNRIVDSDELYRHVLVQVPLLARAELPDHNQFPVRIIGQDVVGVFALARPDGKPVEHKPDGGPPKPAPGDLVENSIGMKLKILPGGILPMGSPVDEYLRDPEETLALVMVSRVPAFGVHEVTQAEYAKVMGRNPSWFCRTGEGAAEVAGQSTDNFPVEQVSYNDALQFCQKLSRLPEEVKAGRQYRLPTEAEREFACRAGSMTPFHTGESISPRLANIRGDRPYPPTRPGKSLGRTTAVGSYPPNRFGLYDMHGNVAEWCIDRIDDRRPSSDYSPDKSREGIESMIEEFLALQSTDKARRLPADPLGSLKGDPRVMRGGSYASDISLCRSASRREQNSVYAHKSVGFRVVCELKD
jgi:formylglycine-generating enzyme required for sulfatase activity